MITAYTHTFTRTLLTNSIEFRMYSKEKRIYFILVFFSLLILWNLFLVPESILDEKIYDIRRFIKKEVVSIMMMTLIVFRRNKLELFLKFEIKLKRQ